MAIVLGLPKGSLQESTFALFKRAGFTVTCSSRSYIPTIDDPEIKCRLLRPQEMSRYVELGLLDAGICGYDWVYENGSDVQEVCELNYSKATSNPVRWVLAVPNDSKIKSVKDLAGKRISSEAVGLVKRYMKKNGVKADVEFSWGATEVKARSSWTRSWTSRRRAARCGRTTCASSIRSSLLPPVLSRTRRRGR